MKTGSAFKLFIALLYLTGRICFAGSPAFFDKQRSNRHIAPPNLQQTRVTFKIAALEFDKRQANRFPTKDKLQTAYFELLITKFPFVNTDASIVFLSYQGHYVDPPKLG